MNRPEVMVYDAKTGKNSGRVVMPSVFYSPLRNDLVQEVFKNMSKNKRQAYAVTPRAGYETSAESWGTGRAVARIPRVPGSGSHRNGQAAYGNQCRGGGMFNPTKVWRRWARKVNVTQKRNAICASLAATSIPALVMAHGHKIDMVPELPLVVSDDIMKFQKTKDVVTTLKNLGCGDDLERVIKSKKIRAGRGKSRNRKYKQRLGPLIVYSGEKDIERSVRNIPGVDICHVERLNLLKLAPGGIMGRLCIYTKSAMKHLLLLFGRISNDQNKPNGEALLKKGFAIPSPQMKNADLTKLINSDEIQSVVNPAKCPYKKTTQKKNTLTNRAVRSRLNPACKLMKTVAALKQMKGSGLYKQTKERKLLRLKKAKTVAKHGKGFYNSVMTQLDDKLKLEQEKVRQEKIDLLAAIADAE